MKQIKRIITGMESWLSLTQMVAKRFEREGAKPLMVIICPPPKTHEQLGYLHSEVLPKLTQALFDAGEISKLSEGESKYYLKVLINYGEWIKFRGKLVFNPFSFEKATTEILSQAIDKACAECEARGVYIPPPKEKI